MEMIKARLKTKQQPPYGGQFTLNAPDKGMVGTGTSFEMLAANVCAWRLANGVPIGLGFEEELEGVVCQRYPDACKETDPRVPPRGGTLSGGDVVLGSKVMVRHWLSGRVGVGQEEANRRAALCANCDWQRPVQASCGGRCGELVDWLRQINHTGATPFDDRLLNCGVCHCFNAVAVWIPLDLQTQDLSEKQRDQFRLAKETQKCWKSND